MVKTKIIKINPKGPDLKILKEVAKEIKKGKLVVYPTETCYGLGTNALDVKAVRKIYEIKRRPLKSNLTVIVDSLETAKKYGKIDKLAEKLVKKFMPGPLTLIVDKKKNFPKLTNPAFAFRISSNPIANYLAKFSKVPIVATSANPHGKPSIYSGEKAIQKFKGKVDIILDSGKLRKVKPSTIVDLRNKKPKLIREGPIDFRRIVEFLD